MLSFGLSINEPSDLSVSDFVLSYIDDLMVEFGSLVFSVFIKVMNCSRFVRSENVGLSVSMAVISSPLGTL